MTTVQILLFAGFDELDALAPFEVLRMAAAAGANLDVQLVTLDEATECVAAHGLVVHPHGKLDITQPPDLLIVPGGGWNNRALRGAWAEGQRGVVPAAIARLQQCGTTIAAVCTGSMLLAAADLARDRAMTTHHGAIEELRVHGAEVVDARVVDDGDLVTAGGVTSGLDLGLWLVERYAGPQVALVVEREMEYERRGTIWRRPWC